jgi:hypothetical protein
MSPQMRRVVRLSTPVSLMQARTLGLMSLFSGPPPGVDSQADGGGGHREAGDQTSNAVSWHDEGDECE